MATEDKSVSTAEPAFPDLGADAQQVTEIESLCMQCGENGITRLLLTKIPHFREVIIMAFECPHCGWRNNEIQSAGTIQPGGCRFVCRVETKDDLNRQLVREEYAVVRIPEANLELPSTLRKSQLTTIEGLLGHCIDDLSQMQPVRQHTEPEQYQAVQNVIDKLEAFKLLKSPFTVEIDDPAGNSYIEDIAFPQKDERLTFEVYERSAEQCEELGIALPPLSEVPSEDVAGSQLPQEKSEQTDRMILHGFKYKLNVS